MKRGLLIILSGPSGVGKGTVREQLFKEESLNLAYSISMTTRYKRPGEKEGIDYFFVDVDTFKKKIEQGELLEYAQFVGNYYGTPKDYVEKQLEAGRNVILEIEIQGALEVKKKFPDTVLMFMVPPSAAVLKERLVKRGTEDMATINARLARAFEESMGVEDYDYIVVNDELERCVDDIYSIIVTEHCKTFNNLDFINNIREELKGFSEGADI